ncbi:MAG: class I tRNA ligase family protein, partial [Anaerolineae bacterium]
LEDGRFPADYICEAVDQTRGWFYSLHALSILLRGEPCYRNVICLGLILDEQGRKMSKHLGNVVEPWEVLERHGADATRWYLFTATQPGESRRFSAGLVGEVVRRFLLTLWNTYAFFVTYATIDQFHPSRAQGIKPTSDLDRWVLSELHSLVGQVDSLLEGYSLTDAGRRIEEFVEVLSNWYVRRSRRRFWKAESDQDKLSAHATLYTCLTTLAKLLAPFCPFVSEAMYQNLVRSVDPQAPESVHLAPFPQADTSQVDEGLIRSMRLAMRVASLGRAARSQAGIKVRQPLPALLVKPREAAEAVALKQISSQVLEELNVKALEVLSDDDELCQRLLEAAGGRSEALVRLDDYSAAVEAGYIVAVDTSVTPELADEGQARELVHRIQNLRRAAGFEITDRIITFYQGDERVHQVMARFGGYIRQETLSGELRQGEPEASAYVERLKLEGAEVTLGVKKV